MTVPMISASPSPPAGDARVPSSHLATRPGDEPGHTLTELRIVRAGFDREADSIRRRADTFAADIEKLVAGADGWEPVIRLATQGTP